ncbi:thiamine pyrophosphate-dependent enzyme [Orrella sp. 11846]|uniref:thiamine pyrophosphate-dependent enzyme n=1 Tax=Orrella sp. 11846 TaxID=3409913 RepID=UPI003B5AC9DF
MSALLHRRDVVKTLLSDRGDLMVISGLGAPAWDITAAGDNELNFPMWGAMGGAAMVGLGLALAQPTRKTLVITGDGEMLMGLGALATIAVQDPDNLCVVVLDNEHYGETGMQKTHTHHGVDLVAMAKGAGITRTYLVKTEDELKALRHQIYSEKGSLFAVIKVDPEKLPLVLPPREGSYIKNRFRIAVLGPDAVHDE